MTLWRKQAVGYWLNPKIVAAGQDAGLVFQAILDVHAELGRDGVLEPRAASVATIHSRLPHLSRRRVLRGLEAASRENLVAVHPDGSLAILGWDDEWRPRKALPEADAATCTRCGGQKPVDGYRQCGECRDYERARWTSRTPQSLRSDSAAETPQNSAVDSAVTPQRSGAETPQSLRSDSADLYGNRSGNGCSEEERRQDQSRQEVGKEGRKVLPIGSGEENQRASASKTARQRANPTENGHDLARKVAGIVEKLATKCEETER